MYILLNTISGDIFDTAKIIIKGKDQIVQLPEKYHFEDDEVFIKKSGNTVILIPKDDPWAELHRGIEMFSDDYMQTREQPPLETREPID